MGAALVLIGGLPGAGKSTLAAALGERLGAAVVSSDRIRGELGLRGDYRPEVVASVYDAMMARARIAHGGGRKVVLDATFSRRSHRRKAEALAAELAAPLAIIVLEADEATALRRVAEARPDSQAGPEALRIVRRGFEPIEAPHLRLDSGRRAPAEVLAAACAYLGG